MRALMFNDNEIFKVGEDLAKGGEGRLQANNNEKKGKIFQQNSKISEIH